MKTYTKQYRNGFVEADIEEELTNKKEIAHAYAGMVLRPNDHVYAVRAFGAKIKTVEELEYTHFKLYTVVARDEEEATETVIAELARICQLEPLTEAQIDKLREETFY